jgi:acetoin utilization deacetylase AcuC-like enzyme
MEKYRLLRERLAGSGRVTLEVPCAASRAELGRAHTPDYVERVFSGGLASEEIRRIGFPWSPQLVERSQRSVGGTLAAARAALDDGCAANLAGGTHHAFPGHGEGFCVFNDVAVAIRSLQATTDVTGFAVIDLDVHQGNGTAAIFADDPRVFTLSVHGTNNFPFRKETSDLDIELPDGTADERYLDSVERGLGRALEARPELAFYIAGADPYVGNRLGRMDVSKAGLAERDRMVFEHCEHSRTALAIVMLGGYAADVFDTVDIHEATVTAASRLLEGTPA